MLAGLGAGLTMSSVERADAEATRPTPTAGADSAALQLSDATSSALTTGRRRRPRRGGRAPDAIGSTAAFVILDAADGRAAGAGRARGVRARPYRRRVTRLGVIFRPQWPRSELRAVAEAADGPAWTSCWLWEDCFDEGGISAAAAALAWTERLHVGIGVLPVPLRNPALAAMEIATLSRLFPGRIDVGARARRAGLDGPGRRPGRVADDPAARVRHAPCSALLAGETVTTDGRYVQLRDVTLGWPPLERPPCTSAPWARRRSRWPASSATASILTGGSTPDDVRAAPGDLRRRSCAAGRGE